VTSYAQENSADDAVPVSAAARAAAPGSSSPDRVFGVLPNYRTANLSDPFQRLSVKRKFYIGYKDSTDYPLFVLGGVLAGLGQATNQHPEFRQGMVGYGKRYAASTSDLLIGNFLTESIMPSLLHQDPRYFRKGEGRTMSRVGYAASRIFVAKNDSGRWNINYSEVLGNAMGAGIGNAYYPGERRLSDNFQRFYSQLATDALSQVLKEFWPDVKRKYFSRKSASQPAAPAH
jgi:hypothetical protein